MSQERTLFNALPNETVYQIFGFLKNDDLIRSFAHLNLRYDDLIRFHIKKMDLTENWEGDQHQLEWICQSIKTLKIDQFHLHYLSNYRFSNLQSLCLINVFNWQEVIVSTNVENVRVWFDENIRFYDDQNDQIPSMVRRFSTNETLDKKCFHSNLVHLTLNVQSMSHLFEIVQHTPNIQHLCVNLEPHHSSYYATVDDESVQFESLVSSAHRLTSLQYLSVSAIYSKDEYTNYDTLTSNEHFVLNEIQTFIDQYCPNKEILKHVVFKLYQIKFHENIWSILERYKKTFDRFDFYVSFKIFDKNTNNIKIPSDMNPVGSHMEGMESEAPYFLHVYSVPFTFDSLYGFISCSELNTRYSFSSVRHLYFTERPLSRPISFRSIPTIMPRLVSINCNLTFANSNISDSDIIIDSSIFYYIDTLRFGMFGMDSSVDNHNFLIRLLSHMPNLRKLIPFAIQLDDTLNQMQYPLQSMKLLDLRYSYLTSFDILPQCMPHLSALLLDGMPSNTEEISQSIGTLFIQNSSLSLVSYPIIPRCGQDRTPYKQIAENAFALIQKMDNRLCHLTFHCKYGIVTFSL